MSAASSPGTRREPEVRRVPVRVTFLRMDQRPTDPPPAWPEPVEVVNRPDCSVAEYRALYDGVGAKYCWWLRRVMPDAELERLLRAPVVRITVLKVEGKVAGFHELDRSNWPSINLSYFGLMDHALGRGLGRVFLRDAIETAFFFGCNAMTVNTCTADHPRALPNYLAAGFKLVRTVDEMWDVPTRLGLSLDRGS